MDQVRVNGDLPTLKISLVLPEARDGRGPDRAAARIRFAVLRGDDHRYAFTANQAAVGIPDRFDPASYQGQEPRFQLSAGVADRLAGGIRALFGSGRRLPGVREPLWLQLASPIGYLAALPWELMLQENLLLQAALLGDRPLLRIPDFTLVPAPGDGPVTVALCVSEPGGGPPPPEVVALPSVLGRALYRGR